MLLNYRGKEKHMIPEDQEIIQLLVNIQSATSSSIHNVPAGIMTDSAVADADLVTLLPGRVVRFSPSPESCW